MHPQIPPMFIVGSPRSGTTLLASLLDGTPWGSPFETHFIPKYFAEGVRARLEDRRTFTALARRILSERPIAQHRLALTPEALFDALPTHDYASLVDAIGRACARAHGSTSWGDKTPHYINDVDLLHTLFPRARIVYLVRDGRDVAVSLLKKPWGPANVYACALKWRYENRLQPMLDTLRRSKLLYDLRYEDLLEEPIGTLSALYRFLGLNVPLGDVMRRATAVRQDNAGGWRQNLTASQVEIFERLAGQTLTRFGYASTHAPRRVGLPQRLAFGAHNHYKHAAHLFTMNVVDTVRIRLFGMEPFAQ